MSASLRQLVVLCQELMSNFRQQHADGCISLTRNDFLFVFYSDLSSRESRQNRCWVTAIKHQ